MKVATLFLGRQELRPWLLPVRALEDVIVDATGAQQWSLERTPKAINIETKMGVKAVRLMRRFGQQTVRLEAVEPDLEVDLLFVFSADLGNTYQLSEILDVIGRAKKAVLLETEVWNTDIIGSTKCITEVCSKFSNIFVGQHSVTDQYALSLGRPVHFLASSTDALAFSGPFDASGSHIKRPIDFFNVGRRDPAQHAAFVNWAQQTGGWYSFTSLNGTTMTSESDHLDQMSQILNRTSVSVCNYARFNDPKRIGQSIEYGCRYFDSLAAGCVIAGHHSTHPTLTDLTEGATLIDMPIGSTAIPSDVRDLLNDVERFAHVSNQQRSVAFRRHDVAHRAAEMFATIGVSTPPKITQRIADLATMADRITPSLARLS